LPKTFNDRVIDERVEEEKEPITGLSFPKMIELNDNKYELVGLGPRRITFLRISVYAAGIYMASESSSIVKKFLKEREKIDDDTLRDFIDLPIDLFIRVGKYSSLVL
jgi:hypothetical protein